MERLTVKGFNYNDAAIVENMRMVTVSAVMNRLAAYEDTGLEPEEIATVKNVVGRIATADYPHNFQRERSDIAAYMYWITSVMKDAKEWWNGMVTRNKGGDE